MTDCAQLYVPKLSLMRVAMMSEQEAKNLITTTRWGGPDGGPFCPRCGTGDLYWLGSKSVHKCAECYYQFTSMSSTAFSSSKLTAKQMLIGVCLYANAAKGISSMQMARDLSITQKAAFLFCHKMREALTASMQDLRLQGVVEVDGAQFGGYRRFYNAFTNEFGKRYYKKKHGNRCVVVVMRQRFGRTIPVIVNKESEAIGEIKRRLTKGTIIQADGGRGWDSLKELYEMMRVQHKYEFSANGACTNWAESYFSILRKVQSGTHHKINRENMLQYASETAWRQDHRDLSPEDRAGLILATVLAAPVSQKWSGYFQRAPAGSEPLEIAA